MVAIIFESERLACQYIYWKKTDHFDVHQPTNTPIRKTHTFGARWFEVFNGTKRNKNIRARSLQLKLARFALVGVGLSLDPEGRKRVLMQPRIIRIEQPNKKIHFTGKSLLFFSTFSTISKKSNLEGVFEIFYSDPQLDQNLKPTRNLCEQLYIYILYIWVKCFNISLKWKKLKDPNYRPSVHPHDKGFWREKKASPRGCFWNLNFRYLDRS